jgi:hypothetical protein
MKILRLLKIYWNRLRFTGSLKPPGRRLTLTELEELAAMFKNLNPKSKP